MSKEEDGMGRFFRAVFVGLGLAGGVAALVMAQPVADVLILSDIPPFELSKVRKMFKGKDGYVGGPQQWTYEADYPGNSRTISKVDYYRTGPEGMSVEVQITLHSSTRWLGHEVERDYRNYFGIIGDSVTLREIDGNRVLVSSSGGHDYTWVSGSSTVVSISYTDLQMTKPEPLEIVRAYLAKYPSSFPAADIRSISYTEAWIRNEMERRVWLMEKWVGVGNADVLKQAEAMRTIRTHVEVFARYREKYLGEKAQDLMLAFLTAVEAAAGKDWPKLVEEVGKLRTWWDANKSRPLTISGVSPGFRLAEGWPILLGGLGAARQLWVERGRLSGYLGRWLSKER